MNDFLIVVMITVITIIILFLISPWFWFLMENYFRWCSDVQKRIKSDNR